jgi:hypothetical protein
MAVVGVVFVAAVWLLRVLIERVPGPPRVESRTSLWRRRRCTLRHRWVTFEGGGAAFIHCDRCGSTKRTLWAD